MQCMCIYCTRAYIRGRDCVFTKDDIALIFAVPADWLCQHPAFLRETAGPHAASFIPTWPSEKARLPYIVLQDLGASHSCPTHLCRSPRSPCTALHDLQVDRGRPPGAPRPLCVDPRGAVASKSLFIKTLATRW